MNLNFIELIVHGEEEAKRNIIGSNNSRVKMIS